MEFEKEKEEDFFPGRSREGIRQHGRSREGIRQHGSVKHKTKERK